MKKLIGILAEEETPSSSAFQALRYFTNSYYVDAIASSGGIPVLLMRSKTTKEVINRLDGILCQGGADVDPRFYNEKRTELCKESHENEDLFQLEIIKESFKKGKKILGICRGCQLINVAFGGTLYQDQSQFTSLKHNHCDNPTKAYHLVSVTKNTTLHSLFNKNTIEVNSLHHQAIKDLAVGFKISAISEDNCIEAIERENILAVQWHPEALRETDKTMDNLFSWLCEN